MAVVPILLRALGREEFALWMAITSLFVAATFIDLGLGGALVNRLSAPGSDTPDKARAVSSSVFGLGFFWGAMAILLIAAYPTVEWRHAFGLSPGSKANPGPATAAMLAYLCVMAPLGLVARIHLGLGRNHVQSLWDAVASVLVLVGMLWAARVGGGLTLVVVVAACVPLMTTAANWMQLLRTHGWLTPRLRDANWPDLSSLLGQGAVFFVIAIFNAAAYGGDSLIAVYVLGAKAAAQPMIGLRLAAALQTLMAGMALPYWPRFSQIAASSASARNRALRETFAFIILISLMAAGGLLLLGPTIVTIWTGGAVSLPDGLAASLATWIFIFGLATGLKTIFSVDHLLSIQLKITVASGLLILACKIGGAVLFGGPGLVWGGAAALLAAAVVPLGVLLVRDMRRHDQVEAQRLAAPAS